MKPPRPFECVVTELIQGLRSGEIVLDGRSQDLRIKSAALHDAAWGSEIEKLVKRDDFKIDLLSNQMTRERIRLEGHIFPHLLYARKREVFRADLEKNVARAKNRIWF